MGFFEGNTGRLLVGSLIGLLGGLVEKSGSVTYTVLPFVYGDTLLGENRDGAVICSFTYAHE